LAIIGFIFLVFGTLLFNEIIEVPLCGLNANTKRAIAERNLETADGSALKDPYYMASSPHANYD